MTTSSFYQGKFKRSRSRTGGRAWLFVLPVLLVQAIVILGPAASAAYHSFTDWDGFSGAEFVGFDNYAQLVDDPDFRRAFLNNLFYLALLPIPFAGSLIVSSLLMRVGKTGIIYRLLFFLPYMLPSVTNSFVWRVLLSPTQGLQALASSLGIPLPETALFGNTATALPTVWFVDMWHWWGFLVVIFLTAMQSIPDDLFEAARLDGASWWQEFRHVTLPGILPTLIFMMVMASIWSFLVFDYVWILTYGGPAGSSEVIGTLVVKTGIVTNDAGYASAMGMTMSLLASIPVVAFLLLRRRGASI